MERMILMAAWVAYVSAGILNHIQVRRRRRQAGIPEEAAAIRDVSSMKGLALEGLAFVIALAFPRDTPPGPAWRTISVAASVAAAALFIWAIRHLGLAWRVKAVVTEDHRLVTTGPYAVVRHPIFTSLFLLLLGTAALLATPAAVVVSAAVFLYGTNIRVRAEDGLLLRRFGERFDAYARRVPAFLPFVK
jgi:protein-S-isoprenylcysteine O-methyltransferase Ste14